MPGFTPPFSVPIVDISGWRGGSPSERVAIAAAIDTAATHVGFMQIVGHGIPAELGAALMGAIDEFFALSPDEKSRWKAPADVNRGYSPPKSERVSLSLGVPTPADLFEAFNIGTEAGDFPHVAVPERSYEANLWPEGLDGFRARVQAWFAAMQELARELARALALALGLEEGFFARFTDHSIDVMRLINYMPPPGETIVEPDQFGMGAHTDYGILTLLFADAVNGLQILDAAGVWRDVQPAPGAILVNLGDLLSLWSNDRWVSTMHRVVPPTGDDGRLIRRRSAAFFHDGNYDAVIECLPGCSSPEHPPRHAPTTVLAHLTAKLSGSRGGTANEAAGAAAERLRAAAE